MLAAIEEGSRIYTHRGELRVQLDVPVDSSLTGSDIDRILRIASWEGGRIDDKIYCFEGGRSVRIEKEVTNESNGVFLRGLSISGVCYLPLELSELEKVFELKREGAIPPSVDNFMDLPTGKKLRTAGVKNNTFVPEQLTYAPCGSYLFSRLMDKVEGTREAGRLGLKVFSLPRVEAYGRYIDLVHDGENLGFIVLAIPEPGLGRIDEYVTSGVLETFGDFLDYTQLFAAQMGLGLREMHDAGKVHRQPHFGNFYFVPGANRLHLMDWDTIVDLEGTTQEQAKLRTIDLGMPRQNFNTLCGTTVDKVSTAIHCSTFMSTIFKNYFRDFSLDFLRYHEYLESLTRRPVDDRESIFRLIHEKLYGDLGFDETSIKTGRNDPCPCGSGVKYKKCCLK